MTELERLLKVLYTTHWAELATVRPDLYLSWLRDLWNAIDKAARAR